MRGKAGHKQRCLVLPGIVGQDIGVCGLSSPAGRRQATKDDVLSYFVSRTSTLAYSDVAFAGRLTFTDPPDCVYFRLFLSASM